MKKIFYFIAAVPFILGSCSQEEFIENNQDLNNKDTNILVAGFESTPSTRVNIDKGGNVTWNSNDAFFVFDNNTELRGTYNLKSGENTSKGVFQKSKGNIISNPSYAFYPNIGDAKILDKKLEVTLPDNYEASLSQNAPMFCKISNDGKLYFKQLMGLLNFNFNNIPTGYNTIKIKSDVSKDGKPSTLVGKFEIDNIDADDYNFTSASTNKMITINNVNDGKFNLPISNGITINELNILACNAENEQIPLLTISQKNILAKHLYSINRPEYKRNYVEYSSEEKYAECKNASDVQKLKASSWFGITKKGGKVEIVNNLIKLTTDQEGGSQKQGGVAGYFFKDGLQANKSGNHIYKLTFKVMRDGTNLNAGFQISCRANGNKKDFVIAKALKEIGGTKLYPYASFSKVAEKADAWETYEVYVNFDIVKSDGKDTAFENAIPEDWNCFEIRIFPKKTGDSTETTNSIFIKDFELSEVIHDTAKL